MKHPSTRTLYDYWLRLRKGRAAPERRDIEPGDIRQILADTFILEHEGPGVCRFRLAGTRICRLYGRELKGENICDLWEGRTQATIARLVDGMRTDPIGVVLGFDAVTEDADDPIISCELLALPLLHDGNVYSRMIGAIVPMEDVPWMGLRALSVQHLASLRYLFPAQHTPSALTPMRDTFRLPVAQVPSRTIGHLTVYEGGKRSA